MADFLKFYTPACSACKLLDKFIEANFPEASIQYIDATKLESQSYVELYKITAVPVMVRLSDGETMVGFNPNKASVFLKGV